MRASISLVGLVAAALIHVASSNGSGAPSCVNGPQSPHDTAFATTGNTYTFTLTGTSGTALTSYVPGTTYNITLAGNSFKGFLFAALSGTQASVGTALTSSTKVGTLVANSNSHVISGCGITQSSASAKTTSAHHWTAPAAGTGPVVFLGVVVVSEGAANFRAYLELTENTGAGGLPSVSASVAASPTASASETAAASLTPTPSSAVASPTASASGAAASPSSSSSSAAASVASTVTRSSTGTGTRSAIAVTPSPSPSSPVVISGSGTATPASTQGAAASSSESGSPTAAAAAATASQSSSVLPSKGAAASSSGSAAATPSAAVSGTPSSSPSGSVGPSGTPSSSLSMGPTPSGSISLSQSAASTPGASLSGTPSGSPSSPSSGTPSGSPAPATPSATATGSNSPAAGTPSATPTGSGASGTPSASSGGVVAASPTPSGTSPTGPVPSASGTSPASPAAPTPTGSGTQTQTPSITRAAGTPNGTPSPSPLSGSPTRSTAWTPSPSSPALPASLQCPALYTRAVASSACILRDDVLARGGYAATLSLTLTGVPSALFGSDQSVARGEFQTALEAQVRAIVVTYAGFLSIDASFPSSRSGGRRRLQPAAGPLSVTAVVAFSPVSGASGPTTYTSNAIAALAAGVMQSGAFAPGSPLSFLSASSPPVAGVAAVPLVRATLYPLSATLADGVTLWWGVSSDGSTLSAELVSTGDAWFGMSFSPLSLSAAFSGPDVLLVQPDTALLQNSPAQVVQQLTVASSSASLLAGSAPTAPQSTALVAGSALTYTGLSGMGWSSSFSRAMAGSGDGLSTDLTQGAVFVTGARGPSGTRLLSAAPPAATGSAQINFESGAVTYAPAPATSLSPALAAHAAFGIIACLVLLPAGAVLGRYFRESRVIKAWLGAHWVLSAAGVACAVVSTAIGIAASPAPHFATTHGALGLASAAVLLLIPAMSSSLTRPQAPMSRAKGEQQPRESYTAWRLAHGGLSYAALLLGLAAAVTGAVLPGVGAAALPIVLLLWALYMLACVGLEAAAALGGGRKRGNPLTAAGGAAGAGVPSKLDAEAAADPAVVVVTAPLAPGAPVGKYAIPSGGAAEEEEPSIALQSSMRLPSAGSARSSPARTQLARGGDSSRGQRAPFAPMRTSTRE